MEVKTQEVKKNERGATMVEYALMVALIAVVCLVIVTQLGGQVNTTFSNIDSSMAAANN